MQQGHDYLHSTPSGHEVAWHLPCDSSKYAQRSLAEFEYRFNRRFDLPEIIPRLVHMVFGTPLMSERLLDLGLA